MIDDVGIVAFAQAIVEWVDENYGRAAAWLASIGAILGMCLLVVGMFYFAVSRL